MPWTNGPLVLYHGCDNISAANIITSGIHLSLSKPLTDFGQGFYTTTNLHQAKNWANTRCQRLLSAAAPVGPVAATVLRFNVDRNLLARLALLCFVTENSNSDYWDLVRHCRLGSGTHLFGGYYNYDVVFGPVSLWPQTLVVKDCDQISFHTPSSLAILPIPSQPFDEVKPHDPSYPSYPFFQL